MSWEPLVILILVLACGGLLAWGLTLSRRPPQIRYVDRAVEVRTRVEVPQRVEVPVVRYVDREVRVPVPAAVEPDHPLDGREYLGEPNSLPDLPDAVPDSVADGARLGGVVVRAASVRGETSRQHADLRRQTMAIALLRRFDPPVLVSAIAAGHRTASRSQVGAAQVCRSVQTKLTDRARGIDTAWQALDRGEEGAAAELTELFREIAVALNDSLSLAAKGRNQPVAELSTELTCVMSRLGDMAQRPHLAFGVGAGPVLRLRAGGIDEVFNPGTAGAFLPGSEDRVGWTAFATAPHDVLVACSATTADFLRRDEVAAQTLAKWSGGDRPSTVAFLAQLSTAHQAYWDDRTAVGVWDGRTDGR